MAPIFSKFNYPADPTPLTFDPAEFGELQDQCVLIEMADKLEQLAATGHAPSSTLPKLEKTNTKKLVVRDIEDIAPGVTNSQFISQLSFGRGSTIKNFLELLPSDITQLAAQVVISVDYYNDKGLRIRSYPLKFPNSTSLKSSLFRSRGQRLGAGIKSIEVIHEGIDTSTDKIVLIESSFLFQDFRTLAGGTDRRKGDKNLTLKPSYSSLLELGTQATADGKIKRYINFAFKYDGTNQVMRKLGAGANVLRTEVRAELIKYTFDIQEDGSIIINTTHRGTFQGFFNGPKTNILSAVKEEMNNLKLQGGSIEARKADQIEKQNQLSAADVQLDNLATYVAQNVIEQQLNVTSTVGRDHDTGDVATDANAPEIRKGINKEIDSMNLPQAQKDKLKKKAANRYNTIVIGSGGKPSSNKPGKVRLTKSQVDEGVQPLARQNEENRKTIQQNLQPGQVLKTVRQILAKRASQYRFISTRILVANLLKDSKIYYGALNEEERKDLKEKLGQSSELAVLFSKITAKSFLDRAGGLGHIKVEFGRGLIKENLAKSKYFSVPFIFLGDFLNSILSLPGTIDIDSRTQQPKAKATTTRSGASKVKLVYDLMKEEMGGDLDTVLGLISYETPYTKRRVNNLPLYYFPISLKKINDFFTREIFAKEKVVYPYGKFVMDLVKRFLEVQFKVCEDEAKTNQTPGMPKIDFVLRDSRRTGAKYSDITFFLYDGKNVINEIKRGSFGKYRFNISRLMPHFYLGGADKGIAKKVAIRDVADPTLKTAVYYKPRPTNSANIQPTAAPEIGLWAPAVFEAEITTIGCPLFHLGQMIFIDGRHFISRAASRQFKATGYYGVHKITHKFTPENGFTTVVNAMSQITEDDIINYSAYNKASKKRTAAAAADAAKRKQIEDESKAGKEEIRKTVTEETEKQKRTIRQRANERAREAAEKEAAAREAEEKALEQGAGADIQVF